MRPIPSTTYPDEQNCPLVQRPLTLGGTVWPLPPALVMLHSVPLSHVLLAAHTYRQLNIQHGSNTICLCQ